MTPSELTLECKPQSYSMLLKSFEDHPVPPPPTQLNSPSVPPTATATDHHGQAHRLQEYVARLEEERIKIDAFKRELPLCMQLLNNAMEASKQLLASQQGTQPVLEEFIPLKHSNSEGESNQNQNSANQNNPSDKANWMTSAQLWSSNDHATINNQPTTTTNETNIGLSVNPNLSLDNKQINNGGSAGAFIPFTKERNVGSTPVIQSLLPDLALVSSRQMEDNRSCCEYDENQTSTGEISNKGLLGNGFVGRNNNIIDHMSQTISSATTKTAAAATTTASQNNRKQRRCWSPDLHRRFVNALQMLGGSQVATPKQIRELMQVDGLTNDEVKSHLQKYRLHTRRPIPSPQSPATPPPQLVVLGSIWVPPEYTTAHGGPHTIYGTHPTSPHYCTSPAAVSQELYPPHSLLPQPHPRFLQHQQQQLQVYRRSTSQQVHSSPESNDDDGRGDRSESIEDGKSDSGSWKDEKGGGEIGVEVRKLTTDDESNNGSEITLKFR